MLDSRRRSNIVFILAGVVLWISLLSEPASSSGDNALSSAVDYCLRHPSSVELSEDHKILCFDGHMGLDTSGALFESLEQHGILVIRSSGGYAHVAMNLSNILREKEAIVVV